MEMEMEDNVVFLKDMMFMLAIGKDAWQRESKVQPVSISLQVENVTSIHDAAATDDVNDTLDYGKMYKTIQSALERVAFMKVRDLAARLSMTEGLKCTRGEIRLPKAATRAEGGFKYNFAKHRPQDATRGQETFCIEGIKCASIIGVNPHERKQKQIVVVNTTFHCYTPLETFLVGADGSAAVCAMNRSQEIIDTVVEVIEGSAYHTIEALANKICESVIVGINIPAMEVSVEKPYAIPSIGAAGVRIRRTREFYARHRSH